MALCKYPRSPRSHEAEIGSSRQQLCLFAWLVDWGLGFFVVVSVFCLFDFFAFVFLFVCLFGAYCCLVGWLVGFDQCFYHQEVPWLYLILKYKCINFCI